MSHWEVQGWHVCPLSPPEYLCTDYQRLASARTRHSGIIEKTVRVPQFLESAQVWNEKLRLKRDYCAPGGHHTLSCRNKATCRAPLSFVIRACSAFHRFPSKKTFPLKKQNRFIPRPAYSKICLLWRIYTWYYFLELSGRYLQMSKQMRPRDLALFKM